ncbi:MAG: hypothetical protein J2O39_09850, partial [Acidimicrobiales bacterium]|nr:hypothetical protein [Acidimicrobiales bacterium]
AGRVGFEASWCVLDPAEGSRAARRLIFVVPNRGRVMAMPMSDDLAPVPMEAAGPDPSIDPGDGLLLSQGWTVAWCGWQWDVTAGLGLEAPVALAGGAPIEGEIRVDFSSDVPIADHPLSDTTPMASFRPYPAADVDDPAATLTVRDSLSGERSVIERGRWRFARDRHGRPIPDPGYVWLDGGFEAHRVYEVVYRTATCPVVGTGLLAVRDFVSFLRRANRSADGPGRPLLSATPQHAFGFGVSQSARFLRHFLHLGLNRDEAGAPVFDGVLGHIGGGRLGEFNQRYGQPSHFGYSGFGSRPPYSPSPGAGLFDRQRDIGAMPKVVLTNSAWEYWRGDAALNHIDPEAGRDLPDPPDTRLYLLAGTDHLGPNPMKQVMPLANPPNSLNWILLLRAAFMNLVAWVAEGAEPPETSVPRLAQGTAETREKVLARFETLPGARLPDPVHLPVTRLASHGAGEEAGVAHRGSVEGSALTCYVSAVDEDGNETAGIRLPEIAVPLAAFTGWNPRSPVPGRPDTIYEFAGSELAFTVDPEARAEAGDPRPSVAERYPDRAAYEAAVEAAVRRLVTARFLLPGDAARATARALDRWGKTGVDRRN